MVGVERLVDAGDGAERRDAGIGAAPRRLDPLRDQSPVETVERDDIAHRAERHQIEPAEQVGLGPRALVPAGPAQRAIDRDDQQKGDADRGQAAVRARPRRAGSD